MNDTIDLKITRIITETSDAKTYIMQEAEGEKIEFLPGQFLTFALNIEGEELRRSYSICTSPLELPEIGITVKKTPDGYASNYLIENLKEGDILKAYPPLGKFTIEPLANERRKLILFAAGSGIAPLMSILKSILFIEKESEVLLFYGNRDIDSIIYRKELNDLEHLYKGRLKIKHILSNPAGDWKGYKGRITRELVLNLFKDTNLNSDAHFYICGPAGMMSQVISALEYLNVEAGRIHTEYFRVIILQNALTGDAEIKPRNVTIIFEGKEHIISVVPEDSILTSALEQGLDLPNSCQMGQCSTCKAKLISGKLNLVEQTALSDTEIAQGYCLTCVGFPLSDDIVIDYDATKNF